MLAELNKMVFSAASHQSPSALLKQSVVNKAVDQWRGKLRTRVRDKGQHFEHDLLN